MYSQTSRLNVGSEWREPILLWVAALALAGCGGRTRLDAAHPGTQSSGAAPGGNSPGWSRPAQDGTCSEGTSPCGKGAGTRCNDLQNDPENCGACAKACTLGIRCSAGTCQQVRCEGALSMASGPETVPGAGAGAATVADVNGDGYLDVVTWKASTGQIGVRLGAGDGSFGPSMTYQAGASPVGVAIGDFNEDGLPDLAVAGYRGTGSAAAVTIWLGAGTGAIAKSAPHGFAAPLNRLVAGDVNNDGHLDVVVTGDGTTVMLGKGDGTLTKAGDYSPRGVVLVRDWNGDGNPDLIALDSTLSVLLGNGDGKFTAQQDCAIAVQPDSTVVLDFNRDGKYDIATTTYNSTQVSVLLGLGGCRFSPATKYAASAPLRYLSSGDLNGDGTLDLVAASATGQILMLTGNGDGTFTAGPE